MYLLRMLYVPQLVHLAKARRLVPSVQSFRYHDTVRHTMAVQGPPSCCKAKENPVADDTRRAQVSEYYGKQLQKSSDLKTNACTTSSKMPRHIKSCLNNIHGEVLAKYYGCGLCLPNYDLTGAKVLDLGCGAGRDVYIASQLVGPTGSVVGVDMTLEQLEVARSKQEYHAEKFGYANVEFYQGTLENLDQVTELELGSFDVIISNCVLNLCTDKKAVLQHCWALLKEGGEMYFSDVYANQRIPVGLQQDPMLWGECLTGALYWKDFENMARQIGFVDPRLVESSPVTISNPKVSQMINDGCKGLEFCSATYRLHKLPNHLEPQWEDYGQTVCYKGSIPHFASGWSLDNTNNFETDKFVPVCGNTWNMLYHCPFLQPHFEFIGNFDHHISGFAGFGTSTPFDKACSKSAASRSGGGGCC